MKSYKIAAIIAFIAGIILLKTHPAQACFDAKQKEKIMQLLQDLKEYMSSFGGSPVDLLMVIPESYSPDQVDELHWDTVLPIGFNTVTGCSRSEIHNPLYIAIKKYESEKTIDILCFYEEKLPDNFIDEILESEPSTASYRINPEKTIFTDSEILKYTLMALVEQKAYPLGRWNNVNQPEADNYTRAFILYPKLYNPEKIGYVCGMTHALKYNEISFHPNSYLVSPLSVVLHYDKNGHYLTHTHHSWGFNRSQKIKKIVDTILEKYKTAPTSANPFIAQICTELDLKSKLGEAKTIVWNTVTSGKEEAVYKNYTLTLLIYFPAYYNRDDMRYIHNLAQSIGFHEIKLHQDIFAPELECNILVKDNDKSIMCYPVSNSTIIGTITHESTGESNPCAMITT